MKLTIYSKNGQPLYETEKFLYSGTFMGERSIGLTVESPKTIDFLPEDYVEFRNERFVLDYTPTAVKKSSPLSAGDAFSYELKFVSLRHELEKCSFKDLVLQDNLLHYTGMTKVEFTGDVKQLADRIQANLNQLYHNQWTISVLSGVTSEVKNISLSDQNCLDALALVQSEYDLNFTVKGRAITIGTVGTIHDHVFEYGKGNGLYSITRTSVDSEAVVTRLRAYGSDENIPTGYKKGAGSLVPAAQYIPSLMLPNYETTLVDYIDAGADKKIVYGIREGVFRADDIKPSIKEMTGELIRAAGGSSISNGRVDEVVTVTPIVNDTDAQFRIAVKDIGFDIKKQLGDDRPMLEFTDGRLGGVACEILDVTFIKDGVPSSPVDFRGNVDVDSSISESTLTTSTNEITSYLTVLGVKTDKTALRTNALIDTQYELNFNIGVKSEKGTSTGTVDGYTPKYEIDNDYNIIPSTSRVDGNLYVEIIDGSNNVLATKNITYGGESEFVGSKYESPVNISASFKTLSNSNIYIKVRAYQESFRTDGHYTYSDNLTLYSDANSKIKLVAGIKAPLEDPTLNGYILTLARNSDSPFVLPDKITTASAGDHFVLTGIFMPDIYVKVAEQRLLEKAKEYLAEYDHAKSTYAIGVDEIFMAKNSLKDVLFEGDLLKIKDSDLAIDNSIVVQQLNIKHGESNVATYEVTLSDKPVATTLSRVQSDVTKIEQNTTVIKASGEKQARRNISSLNRLKDYTFDPETGKFRTENLAVGSIDALYLSVGTKAANFVLNANISANYQGNPNKLALGSGVLVHREVSHGEANIDANFMWSLPSSVITLTDNSKVYYIYAKCSSSTSTSEWFVSDQMLRYDNELAEGWYYFRVGVVFDVIDGVRADVLDYGRSFMNGRFLTTGVVKSADGSTYFDLDNGILKIGGGSGLKNLDEWAAEEAKINSTKTYVDSVLPTELGALQAQIDGQIESFFYQYDPSLSNEPALSWNIDTVKDRHLNDTFTNTLTGASWRFVKENGVYVWKVITDTATSKALELAGKAQDTADGKRRVFTSQPTTPYDAGDLWSQGSAGDLMTCITSRDSGAYVAGDWGKASKYTDDTAASAAQTSANNAAAAASAAKTSANNAAAAASAAQASANGANAAIADMSSDDKITASEKQQMKKEWDVIVSEKTKNDTQADTFGVSKTAYGTAYTALATAIGTNLDNLSTTWDLGSGGGATLRAMFKAYYDERTNLLNTISAKAKTLADNAQAKVDGLHIGGRNILLAASLKNWSGNDGGFGTLDYYSDYFRLTTSPSCGIGIYKRMDSLLTSPIANLPLILSFDACSNGGDRIVCYADGKNGGIDTTLTTSWKRYSITYSPSVGNNLTVVITGLVPDRWYYFRNFKLEIGNKATDWTPAPEDVQASIDEAKNKAAEADYLKTALANDTSTQRGLTSTTLIKLGAKNESGTWVEKAGVNGAGTGLLDPRVYAGGSLLEAIRRVNETLNNTPTTNPKANFVVTDDGRVFAYAGYIGDFQLINGLLSTNSLDIGKIDGIPRIRVKDSSNNGRTAVEIGDFDLTNPSNLSGGWSVDVTPIYADVSTGDAIKTFWVGQGGVSSSKVALSNNVSANTKYVLSMTIEAVNSMLQDSYVDNYLGEDSATIQANILINIKDANDSIIGHADIPFNAISTTYNDVLAIENQVSIDISTLVSGNLYVELLLTQYVERNYSIGGVGYKCISNTYLNIKSGTSIKLTSGKSSIEIGRGFQAIYGAKKYVRMVDAAGEPTFRVKGDIDTSGVLLAGSIDKFGQISKSWGWKKTTLSSTKSSKGVYVITHNLGHTDYITTANSTYLVNNNAGMTVTVISETSSSVTLQTRYGDNLYDAGFNFTIVGSNA